MPLQTTVSAEQRPGVSGTKLLELLGGLKLSFILMALLTLLVAQRAIVAQRAALPSGGETTPWFLLWLDRLGVGNPGDLDIPFFVAVLLLMINLGASCVLMLRKGQCQQRALQAFRSTSEIERLPCQARLTEPRLDIIRLTRFLKKSGYRVKEEQTIGETRLYAGRHEAGHWGVLFFHLTFFVVLLGALLSFATRHAGYLELSPGERFEAGTQKFQRSSPAPLFTWGADDFTLELERLDLSYWQPGEAKQRASEVRLYDSGGQLLGTEWIAVNKQLQTHGRTIYQGSRNGFVAGLTITDERGTEVQGKAHFILPKNPDQLSITTRIVPPGVRMALLLELHTDQLKQIEGMEPLASKHPVSLLKVTSESMSGRRFQGVLFGGGCLDVEGLTVRFDSLKPYTSYLVVRDAGVPVIFAGFALLLVGLLITYFWVPERCWVSILGENGQQTIVIGAHTEKYKASFKARFEEQIRELQQCERPQA